MLRLGDHYLARRLASSNSGRRLYHLARRCALALDHRTVINWPSELANIGDSFQAISLRGIVDHRLQDQDQGTTADKQTGKRLTNRSQIVIDQQ